MANKSIELSNHPVPDAPLIVEDLLLQAEEQLKAGHRAASRQLLRMALRIGAGRL